MKAPEIGTKVVIVRPDECTIKDKIIEEGDVAKVVGIEGSLKNNDLLLLVNNPKWENMYEGVQGCTSPCLVVYLSECDIYEDCIR